MVDRYVYCHLQFFQFSVISVYLVISNFYLNTDESMNDSLGVITIMLLSSSLPFYGKNPSEVRKRIIANNYQFTGKRWKSVSLRAKAFIRDLLVTNPDERLDADAALGSEWLNHSESTNTRRVPHVEEEEMARSSMLRYAGYCKLKKMVSKSLNECNILTMQF